MWVGADPTNRGLAGETHVKIGHGRHYADVPPIKGVYRGAAVRRARRGGDDDAPRSAGQRARRAPALGVASTVSTVSSSPSSPLNPHPASPVEMQERILAEREGKPFLLLRDGAQTQHLVRLPTEATG